MATSQAESGSIGNLTARDELTMLAAELRSVTDWLPKEKRAHLTQQIGRIPELVRMVAEDARREGFERGKEMGATGRRS